MPAMHGVARGIDERLLPQCLVEPTGTVTGDAWDLLSADHFYSCRDWLRYCSSEAVRAGSVHIGDPAAPSAAVPVTLVDRLANGFYRWDRILAEAGLPHPPPRGVLVGAQRGYRTALLGGGVSSASTNSVEALLDGLRELAAEPAVEALLGTDEPAPVVAMYLGAADVARLRALGAVNPPVLLNLDAWLDVPSGGFDAYAGTLPRKRRQSVHQERERFEAAGYLVDHVDFTAHVGDAGRLLASTERRYGNDVSARDTSDSFARQASALGHRARMLLCRNQDGIAVGFLLYYVHGDAMYLRATGFDYAKLAGAMEYFNLVYHLPIEIAQGLGIRRIHAGIEAPHAKALRGARLHGTWMVDLSVGSPLRGLDQQVEAANRLIAQRLIAGSAAVTRAVTPDVAALLEPGSGVGR
jgi:hypothetical protein